MQVSTSPDVAVENKSLSTEIMRLMSRGAANERIFNYIAWDFPEAFDVEELRLEAGKKQSRYQDVAYVPFDPTIRVRLQKLISVLRVQHNKDLKRQSVMDKAVGEIDIQGLDEVNETFTHRFTSGTPEVDNVFGTSRFYDADFRLTFEETGLPRGLLYLLGGASGVGKTKFYTALAIELAERHDRTILIFQTEMNPGQYKNVVMDMYRTMQIKPTRLQNIIVRRERNYQEQCRIIKEIKPDLAINDSVKLTHGAGTQHGIEEIVFFWKEAMGDHTCGWFIDHLNEKGGMKGNNLLKYLTDGWFKLEWADFEETEGETVSDYKDRIKLVSGKNRKGKKNQQAYARHVDEHIEFLGAKVQEIDYSESGEYEFYPLDLREST